MQKVFTPLFVMVAILVFAVPALSESPITFPAIDFSKCEAYDVVRVVDGDTFVATNGTQNITVRLQGVDTPETKHPKKPVQAYGKEASQFLTNLLKGEKVYLLPVKEQFHSDKYGRIVAYTYRAPDGLFVNAEIIRQGYGHSYPKYPGKYTDKFVKLEQYAMEARKGLWGEGGKLSPKPEVKAELPGEYMVEDYWFSWTAAESGQAKIQVNKGNDNPATISINEGRTMGDSIRVSPMAAEKIGGAFARVNRYYKDMKGKKEQSKAIVAGDYKVVFFTNEQGAFSVNLKKDEAFSFNTVALSRKQAAELAQALKDALKLAAYIDAKVKF